MAPETGTKGNDAPVLVQRGKVMKICLVVSLLIHLSMLLGIQKAFPINWFPEPLRTYHVELITRLLGCARNLLVVPQQDQ